MKKKRVYTYLIAFLNDIFLLIGAIFIITATYRINLNAGLYVTGAFFVLFAVLLSYKPRRKGGD